MFLDLEEESSLKYMFVSDVRIVADLIFEVNELSQKNAIYLTEFELLTVYFNSIVSISS